MIYLLRAPEAVIASSTFEAMDLLLADTQAVGGSLIRVDGDVGTPGHHLVFCNNVMEPIRATHVLELIGTSCDVVAFSNFGRIGPGGDGSLRTKPSGSGATGHSLVVFGSNFHNVQPVQMIRLQGLAHAVIDGTVFYAFDTNDVPVVVDPGTCRNLHFGASQVRRAP